MVLACSEGNQDGNGEGGRRQARIHSGNDSATAGTDADMIQNTLNLRWACFPASDADVRVPRLPVSQWEFSRPTTLRRPMIIIPIIRPRQFKLLYSIMHAALLFLLSMVLHTSCKLLNMPRASVCICSSSKNTSSRPTINIHNRRTTAESKRDADLK